MRTGVTRAALFLEPAALSDLTKRYGWYRQGWQLHGTKFVVLDLGVVAAVAVLRTN